MSCDAIALSAIIWLAAGPAEGQPTQPVPIVAPATPLSAEPLFADIVSRADALKARAEGWSTVEGDLPGFAAFRSDIAALADLDMKAHFLLAKRGSDGDLKCILRGIAQDLPVRLGEVEKAGDAKARSQALREMVWLLRDNVEVITTPASVTSGT